MSIKSLPSFKRPREKLVEKGPQGLSDVELIALLLRFGNKQHDVMQIARTVLPTGTVQDIAESTFEHLCTKRGIGLSSAACLMAAKELAERLHNTKQATYIQSAEDVLKIISYIKNKTREYFVGMYLNSRQQLIRTHTISIGSLDVSIAHPREVFEPAVRFKASAIIVAHNHPSGDPEPSHADILLTKRLMRVGEIMGIQLIDHIIIAEHGYFSMKESE